jgi:hypothetical protein
VRKAVFILSAAAVLALAAAVVAVADDGYGDETGATTQAPVTEVRAASSETYSFKATMNRGLEVPKPKAPAGAKGTFSAKSVENGAKVTITWNLVFSGLSGKAVAAHIHQGRPGKAGPVVFALCGPCRSGQTGKGTIKSAVEEALEDGQAYVNVHTAKNPAGEIRGQVKQVGKS